MLKKLGAKFKNLILAPSRKNPQVNRWQKFITEERTSTGFHLSEDVLEHVFGKGKTPFVTKSPIMDFPSVRKMVEQKSRHKNIKSNFAETRVAIVDSIEHPAIRAIKQHNGNISPYTVVDGYGHSLIVLCEDAKKALPLLSADEFSAYNIPLEEVIAVHELGHAWDLAATKFASPEFQKYEPAHYQVMGAIFGHEDRGLIPPVHKEKNFTDPRVVYMLLAPSEIPAILTELGYGNPEQLIPLSEDWPWVWTYLNAFYGNDFGSKLKAELGVR